jgi:hypothetical protein
MCYSPEADVIAGLVVGAVGVDALRHVDDRRFLPLAAVPLVLAAHQLIEAVAWWGLQDRVPETAGDAAASIYLIIALGIVPILVPYAVMRSEPLPGRRSAIVPFVVLGVCVSVVMLAALVVNPHNAAIEGRYIAYNVTLPAGGLLTGFYAVAVCTPLLLSSHRRLVLFGMVNVPAFLVLSALLSAGLISLWCIWAAVSSLVVARLLRGAESSKPIGSSRPITAA